MVHDPNFGMRYSRFDGVVAQDYDQAAQLQQQTAAAAAMAPRRPRYCAAPSRRGRHALHCGAYIEKGAKQAARLICRRHPISVFDTRRPVRELAETGSWTAGQRGACPAALAAGRPSLRWCSNRTWGSPSGSRTRHQVFALGRL
jgi:hypothetical protein